MPHRGRSRRTRGSGDILKAAALVVVLAAATAAAVAALTAPWPLRVLPAIASGAFGAVAYLIATDGRPWR